MCVMWGSRRRRSGGAAPDSATVTTLSEQPGYGQLPSAASLSVSDPALAQLFGVGVQNWSGVDISETTAMSLSAVYRAVSIIAGTIASLPLRTLRDTVEGIRLRMGSLFDDPGGQIGLYPYNWVETVVAHLLLHGNAFLRYIYGGAGQLIALLPVHPYMVSVELPTAQDRYQPAGGKWFRLAKTDGSVESVDATGMLHIMGLSLDGVLGLSIIGCARNGLGTALAGDRAAANMFGRGALFAGMVTPDGDDVEEDDVKTIRAMINRQVVGWENAATVPVINRRLKFTPWSMSLADAQFLESRQFSIREVARWFGMPPHLLMETSAASNWGTGIEQQNLGLSRFNLLPVTKRIEGACSTILPKPRFVEFDFAGLERPDPETEIKLLIDQVNAGLLTIQEARAIRNLPPVAVVTGDDSATLPADALAEMLQKIYLSVDKVITRDEAREIVNRAGGGLPVPTDPADFPSTGGTGA